MNLPWARTRWRSTRRVNRLGAMVAAVLTSVVAASVLGASAPPARASQGSGVTLTVSYRWGSAPNPSTWTAYSVTVRNEAAGLFEGEVRLVPNSGSTGVPFQSVPQYHAAVSLSGGSARTVDVYAI